MDSPCAEQCWWYSPFVSLSLFLSFPLSLLFCCCLGCSLSSISTTTSYYCMTSPPSHLIGPEESRPLIGWRAGGEEGAGVMWRRNRQGLTGCSLTLCWVEASCKDGYILNSERNKIGVFSCMYFFLCNASGLDLGWNRCQYSFWVMVLFMVQELHNNFLAVEKWRCWYSAPVSCCPSQALAVHIRSISFVDSSSVHTYRLPFGYRYECYLG